MSTDPSSLKHMSPKKSSNRQRKKSEESDFDDNTIHETTNNSHIYDAQAVDEGKTNSRDSQETYYLFWAQKNGTANDIYNTPSTRQREITYITGEDISAIITPD